jgi:glycosyltransferase involved in cell wall biosynthesis
MSSPLPLFSIVIATYNAEDYIEETLKSIFELRGNVAYEVIVIDADSSDNTKAIIHKYRSQIASFISEPDNGIYDAWNKGINASKGDWICFLGAGDLLRPNALNEYKKIIQNYQDTTPLEYISGKVTLIDKNKKIFRTIGKAWNWKAFKNYMCVAHVASLHSKNLYKKYGMYNLAYKITGDYELLLRAGKDLNAAFCNLVVAEMLVDGASTTFKSVIEQRNSKVSSKSVSVFKGNYDFVVASIKFFIKRLIKFK